MFDLGNCALGHVRIDRHLRRRRNDDGNRDASNVGDVNIVRNVNVVGNIGDIRNVDNLRDAGNVGIVGNVRFRLEQHCFIVDANLNVAHNTGRRRSNRTSVGIYRDRQSWGQLRSCGTDHKRIAHSGDGTVGANDASRYISACCFIHDDKHCWEHSSRE
jgi:hypothetical protein